MLKAEQENATDGAVEQTKEKRNNPSVPLRLCAPQAKPFAVHVAPSGWRNNLNHNLRAPAPPRDPKGTINSQQQHQSIRMTTNTLRAITKGVMNGLQ